MLIAEKASLFDSMQTLEKMISTLSKETSRQELMKKEQEVEKRKMEDENALLSRQVKKLKKLISRYKDEDNEDSINNSQARDEPEPGECRIEVIADYETMYTAPAEVDELNNLIVPAPEDIEMTSQTMECVAMDSMAP